MSRTAAGVLQAAEVGDRVEVSVGGFVGVFEGLRVGAGFCVFAVTEFSIVVDGVGGLRLSQTPVEMAGSQAFEVGGVVVDSPTVVGVAEGDLVVGSVGSAAGAETDVMDLESATGRASGGAAPPTVAFEDVMFPGARARVKAEPFGSGGVDDQGEDSPVG